MSEKWSTPESTAEGLSTTAQENLHKQLIAARRVMVRYETIGEKTPAEDAIYQDISTFYLILNNIRTAIKSTGGLPRTWMDANLPEDYETTLLPILETNSDGELQVRDVEASTPSVFLRAACVTSETEYTKADIRNLIANRMPTASPTTYQRPIAPEADVPQPDQALRDTFGRTSFAKPAPRGWFRKK